MSGSTTAVWNSPGNEVGMKKLAFVFPGQGSQKVGMGKDFADRFSLARELFAQADETLGFKISEVCFEGPEDKLLLTAYTQPALLAVSTIAFRLLAVEPGLAAGHSLGEYSALVAAGSLTFEDALRLVHKRGRYMQEAVPVGVGAMAAVLGAPVADIEAALLRVTSGSVQIANWNSDDQIVIAGHAEAVKDALALMKGTRSVMLPVSAPFHSALMKSAEERLSADLDAVEFQELKFPVITNVDAGIIRRGEEARDALKRQVSRPVLWRNSMLVFQQEKVEASVELGPGKVLTGLLKRISRPWPSPPELFNVEDAESLEACRGALSGAS
jgi:[acyl-carrier-protein] S-malonyltransferase